VTDVRTLSTDELRQRLDRDSGLHLLNVQTDHWLTGELIPGSPRHTDKSDAAVVSGWISSQSRGSLTPVVTPSIRRRLRRSNAISE
jgi:hypothetical protein